MGRAEALLKAQAKTSTRSRKETRPPPPPPNSNGPALPSIRILPPSKPGPLPPPPTSSSSSSNSALSQSSTTTPSSPLSFLDLLEFPSFFPQNSDPFPEYPDPFPLSDPSSSSSSSSSLSTLSSFFPPSSSSLNPNTSLFPSPPSSSSFSIPSSSSSSSSSPSSSSSSSSSISSSNVDPIHNPTIHSSSSRPASFHPLPQMMGIPSSSSSSSSSFPSSSSKTPLMCPWRIPDHLSPNLPPPPPPLRYPPPSALIYPYFQHHPAPPPPPAAAAALKGKKAARGRQPSVEEMLAAVLKKRLTLHRNAANQGDEVQATSTELSLICPLGKVRMINPCRGTNCTHSQCFEAITFLNMAQKTSKWECPQCSKKIPLGTLFIDVFFLSILQNTSTETENVILEADGRSWSEKKKKETVEDEQKFISILEADPSAPTTPPRAKRARTESSGVIDLTDDAASSPEVVRLPVFSQRTRFSGASGSSSQPPEHLVILDSDEE